MPPRTPTALEQLQNERQQSLAANVPPDVLNAFYPSSRYNFNSRKFPTDLGTGYNRHYMVININVPVKLRGGSYNPSATSGITVTENLDQQSRLDTLRGIDSKTYAGLGTLIPRQTKRIAESIALYMPPNVVYNTHNEYEDISMSALAGKTGIAAIRVGEAAKAARRGQVVGTTGAATIIADAAGTLRTVTTLMQSPINPAIEVFFSNTLQRQFVFEFLLAPRTEEESKNIKEIIKTLRYHAAPAVNSTTGNLGIVAGTLATIVSGLFWVPPAEFDISFFKDGVENTHIPRINTCVLERIEVDVTPTGIYSTFSNGHPVATRLSLGFRELEPVHKTRVEQGF
jgi:hypothetical protein